MLKRIVLRDFVIVAELELDFSHGFSVLTGETGAGKSILVDALQLATGARADTHVIREGAPRTDVSVEFDCPGHLDAWLQEAGFDRDDTLLLRRTVDVQGKSRAWINGSPATVAQLRSVGEHLLDIHGQHAWQSLTRPEAVRTLLDGYAQIELGELTLAWQRWRHAQEALEQASAAQDGLQRERDRLQWQIAEVDKLAPVPGEWQEINTEHGRLSNAQALLDAGQTALDKLDGEDLAAINLVNAALESLQAQQSVEPEFLALNEILSSSLAQLEDCAHTLRAYLRKTDPDPLRLAEVDERLSNWVSLARRYKRTPDELAAIWQGWKDDLMRLDASADLDQLQAAANTAQKAYHTAALAVGKQRQKAAPKLATAVSLAMQGLGMAGGTFEVQLEKLPQAAQFGLEAVHFLMAGHPGATPRPVSKVASGGELSRIALAIAVTTSQLGTAQTLIFDEVDAGIGGAVAETVGRLMKQLGVDRQVMAVTHLPQVAACADHHLLVAKQLHNGQTQSSVLAVQGEQRVAEIARMLGGERLSGTTQAHARELLDNRN